MADLPPCSSSSMEEWQEKRGLQTMNLRSVFTLEQQRVLESYYDNGMTNQSKSCFQLILQCAQETKLDFSVVRTWVGNKRRKLASRNDQNAGVSHSLSLSNHSMVGGVLSNHGGAGVALSNHTLAGGALVAGAMLTAEMAAARNIQRGSSHLLPSSSSSSSSSPLSSVNNNNDVILTGIYSLGSASSSRATVKPLPSDAELPAHVHQTLLNQSQHRSNSSVSSPLQLHSRLGTLSLPRYKTPSLSSSPSLSSPPSSSPPGPPINSLSKRVGFPTSGARAGEAARGAGVRGGVPRSWARQYGSLQSGPWPSPSQPQPRPRSNHQTLPPHPPRPRPSPPPHPIPPPSDHSPRIHQVFSLSERGEGEEIGQGQPSDRSRLEKHRQTPHPSDAIGCLSIAMETGDEEDEWRREEELSNMAATAHGDLQRGQGVRDSPSRGEGSGERILPSPSLVLSSSRPGPYPRDSYPVSTTTLQTSASIQVPVSPSAPWLISNSRKRTLQDRTQFSDVDLSQLKRYWDRGMTSLGSVCREKINAAANQLNVDTEIVKTWIGNRRRKYRLMGIEIPSPKGGPAVFLTSQEGEESPSALSSDGEGLGTPELGDNLNDGASFCLSEDGTSDSYQREEENGVEDSSSAPMVHNVKIEVVDDDDDGGVEMVGSDMENMQNLLEFKLEEVQYLESQLENQNQRYYELETFTKSLLTAVRTNNLDRQQELLASLPQPADQDWDMSPEGGANSISLTTHSASNHESPLAESNDETPLVNPNKDLPLVTINEDGSLIAELNESSVSEELETETGPE
ncbi:highly divergent homeobox isoform X1 [Salmo trutta]|uniref:highly divergent homeobox isoform X1 n=2 Tax=Salmo trutta TaxID=8032 RepID=UPI0011305D8B|nr:highly divergent homeobox-like isoform X1 [Salmo trutta]XP_029627985.1 highly divergent homeobox-like isoform X1 [Salmo trutta]XP_029627986.1 highly divergent homeobox-like isoform X1 [Salmo trutta]